MSNIVVRITYVEKGQLEKKIEEVADYMTAVEFLDKYIAKSVTNELTVVEAHIFHRV